MARIRLSRAVPVAAVAVAATAILGTVIQPATASAAVVANTCSNKKTVVASQAFVRNGNETYGELRVYAWSEKDADNKTRTRYCVQFNATSTKNTKVASYKVGLVKGNGVTPQKNDGRTDYKMNPSALSRSPLVDANKQKSVSVSVGTTQCVYVLAQVNYTRDGIADTINWAKSNAKNTADRVDPATWVALCGPGSSGPAKQIADSRRYDFTYNS